MINLEEWKTVMLFCWEIKYLDRYVCIKSFLFVVQVEFGGFLYLIGQEFL